MLEQVTCEHRLEGEEAPAPLRSSKEDLLVEPREAVVGETWEAEATPQRP